MVDVRRGPTGITQFRVLGIGPNPVAPYLPKSPLGSDDFMLEIEYLPEGRKARFGMAPETYRAAFAPANHAAQTGAVYWVNLNFDEPAGPDQPRRLDETVPSRLIGAITHNQLASSDQST